MVSTVQYCLIYPMLNLLLSIPGSHADLLLPLSGSSDDGVHAGAEDQHRRATTQCCCTTMVSIGALFVVDLLITLFSFFTVSLVALHSLAHDRTGLKIIITRASTLLLMLSSLSISLSFPFLSLAATRGQCD